MACWSRLARPGLPSFLGALGLVKFQHAILIAPLASVLLLGCTAAQPLHRSPASIRASLLRHTPIGTSYQAVEAFVRKEGWQPHTIEGAHLPDRLLGDAAGFVPAQQVRRSMDVYLGDYWAWPIFGRKVWGYWLFDTNNRLLEVWVTKHTQGL